MYEDFEDEQDGGNTAKDLRKQRDALSKELKELREQFADSQKQATARSIQEVLTSKGANPKLAKFALADGVDDEAGAEKWLAENGELFGFQPVVDPAVDADDLAAMQAVQDATSTGGVTNASRLAQQSSVLDEASTPEAWMAAAKSLKHGTPAE